MQGLQVCVYDSGAGHRVGSVVEDRVHDLNLCCVGQLNAKRDVPDAYRLANTMVPHELGEFLAGGSDVLAAARQALEWAVKEADKEVTEGRGLYHPARDVQLKAPILPSSKVICMILTYEAFADMHEVPTHPFPHYYTKMSQVVVGPEEWVVVPKYHDGAMSYGTELTVVIGTGGRNIPEGRVEDHIWGYTILTDLTLQGRPSMSHKVFDTSAPVGPWIVPKDQLADPQNLNIGFRINGKQVQDGNTRNMLSSVPAIVAEVSKWLTLNPGDIIATGEVGATEPLRPGDVGEAEIEGIGVLRNPVMKEE